MTLKPPKRLLPYVPGRANTNQKILRRTAAVLTDQIVLESFLMQMAIDKPESARRPIQTRAIEELRPYLRFVPQVPAWLRTTDKELAVHPL